MADLLAGPGRVLFWLHVLAIELIDTISFQWLRAWMPPSLARMKVDFLYFPKVLLSG